MTMKRPLNLIGFILCGDSNPFPSDPPAPEHTLDGNSPNSIESNSMLADDTLE